MSNQVYEYVTERILKQLESGTVPWHKPWRTSDGLMFPTNYASKKTYRGVNVFLLGVACWEHGFASNYWLTYTQAQELGGFVRKGSKSEMVVFWKILERENPEAVDAKDYIPMLRYYRVFNLEQIDGIEKPHIDGLNEFVPIEQAQSIAQAYGKNLTIRHGGNRACYRFQDDSIEMPQREAFEAPEEYYSTLFHEFTHSTGHEKRLNRSGVTEMHSFGDEIYSKEELIAEMGAAMLCAMAGIENKTINNSAAYIQGWLKQLKDDAKLVVYAAANAQKASDFILGKELAGKAETKAFLRPAM
jgi:antirestriction protein ArdC